MQIDYKPTSYKDFKSCFRSDSTKGFTIQYGSLFYTQIGFGNEWKITNSQGKCIEIATLNVKLRKQEISEQSDDAVKIMYFDNFINKLMNP